METSLLLPIIDLFSPDKISTAQLICRACIDHGFFYLMNHGVSEELIEKVLRESKNFYSLPLDEKMMLARSAVRGYSPLYHEKTKPSTTSKGDSKEMFTYGSSKEVLGQLHLNKWPSQDLLPLWKPTMECYYKNVLDVGRKLLSLVALALDLEEDFFERVGALNDDQATYVSLLRYPGELNPSGEVTCGSDAHSDFGMITLLATDGVPGLQVCRNKDKEPRVWEDIPGVKGAFVVNIGDLMEDGLMGFSDQQCIEWCQWGKNVTRLLHSSIQTQTVLWSAWRAVVVKHLLPSSHRSDPKIISTSDSVKPWLRIPTLA